MLRTCPEDQPIAAQLLGSEPDVMLKAARMVMDRAPISFLDINAACPARKVFKKGAGSCLFNDPAPLYRTIEHLVKNLPVPITVKMRVGLKQVDAARAAEFAKGCESAGASALFVHGRTRDQKNYGPVSYEAVRAVKQAVRIPVVGSGNVMNPMLAKKMLDETGCDGVLVAKGSFGNPTIFRETEEYLRTGVWKPSIDLREKISILKKHLQLVREFEGDRINWRVGELGKVCLWYLKGFAEASRMRARIFASKSDQELISLIDSIPESRPAA
jgi:nifR3 family TIM-barrel protein